jgi:4-amino-4-deoxy-L-arabinose transferase-like glycosyltransferase
MESRPIRREEQVPSPPIHLGTPFGHGRERVPGLALACTVLLGIALLTSLWLERFEIWALILAAAALATLLYATGWWRSRKLVAITIILDVAMIFLFLWSLDEREHVVIRVVNGQYIGSMGTASVQVGQPTAGGRFGLYSGSLFDYRVSPLGEAQMYSPTAPLPRFGEWMRLALAPAWTNLRVISSGHVRSSFSNPSILTGSWRVNRRGEYTGSPYSNVLLGTGPSGDYTIEGDLMRGDGTQGVLLGVDSSGHGYAFEARADVPDVQWVQWNVGVEGNTLAGSTAILPLTAMIQRDTRLVLANELWAFALLVLVPPLYLALLWLFHALGGSAEEELLPLERLLERRGPTLAAAACVAVVATVLTALVASNVLERIPHVQDSVADLFQAKTLALGRLWVPVPRLHSFFTEEFIPMYDGKWFGKYPPGWPLILTVGVLLHIPWLINPILSGAIVLLIFAIGREVYSAPIGLLAALLTVSSPFFLFLGGSFMPHTSTVFYLLGATYLFVRWYQRSSGTAGDQQLEISHLLPSGCLLGMSFLTRQTDAIAFALPFAAFLAPTIRRKRFRPILWLLIGGVPPIAFLLLYNWILTGSALTSPYSLWWPFDRLGFGPTVGGGGFTPAQGLWNTSFNLQMLLAHLFGWPFYLTLTLAGVPFITGRATRWDWVFLASAGAVILAYVAYWNPGVMYGPRYYFATVPVVALLTARGLEELYRWPLRIRLHWGHDRIAALAIPAAVLALLVTYNVTVYLPAQIPIYQGYNYTSAASINAVQRAGIHHALIFVVSTPSYEWWSYGAVFSSNSPLLDGDIVYARDQGASDRELMRAYPGRSYYRLNDTTLTRLSV